MNKSSRVHALFEGIANNYDLLNDVISLGMHRLWKKKVATNCSLKNGDKAIDICAGTGDIAFELAKTAGEKGEIIALDFSDEMIKIGKQKALNLNLHNIVRFIYGDALKLPYPDNYFNAATIGYGLRNVENIEAALLEMKRVIKIGGKVVSLDLGHPPNKIYRKFYFFYLSEIVSLLGQLISKNFDSYYYLFDSLQKFPKQEALKAIMEQTGLTDVHYYNLLGGVGVIHVGTK